MPSLPVAEPPSMHILAVDDEPHLLRALSMNLAGRGYRVSTAGTARAALDLIGALHIDVIVLDLGLPDMDGLDVIRRIRLSDSVVPILVLSARSASQEKVHALDLGATDYVTKPFDMSELLARLRAAGRRLRVDRRDEVVTLDTVVVDLAARTIRSTDPAGDQAAVHLTPTEWRMLDTLLRRPGMLVTSTELLTAMRGAPDHTERSYLRIYMQQLRRKLEADPSRPRHLLTELGLGYRFVP